MAIAKLKRRKELDKRGNVGQFKAHKVYLLSPLLQIRNRNGKFLVFISAKVTALTRSLFDFPEEALNPFVLFHGSIPFRDPISFSPLWIQFFIYPISQIVDASRRLTHPSDLVEQYTIGSDPAFRRGNLYWCLTLDPEGSYVRNHLLVIDFLGWLRVERLEI
ncbi:hypothetical protein EUTSA_v10001189mg [Eutrema salsugineum]|uniref:Uncharacterized protein n=1 Tax=Eutrema salsugineum TaxID=72664 RepID=V4LJA9_EUTSA|nr:hypothetical protein EUTSA_v10001189mg [Eutrema salsugineum]